MSIYTALEVCFFRLFFHEIPRILLRIGINHCNFSSNKNFWPGAPSFVVEHMFLFNLWGTFRDTLEFERYVVVDLRRKILKEVRFFVFFFWCRAFFSSFFSVWQEKIPIKVLNLPTKRGTPCLTKKNCGQSTKNIRSSIQWLSSHSIHLIQHTQKFCWHAVVLYVLSALRHIQHENNGMYLPAIHINLWNKQIIKITVSFFISLQQKW